jgi:cell division protein FtsW
MSPTARRPVLTGRGAVARRHKPDYALVMMSALLLVVGLIIVYAISPGLSAQKQLSENYFVTKQLMAIGLGVVAFIVTSIVPFSKWKHLQRPLLIAAVVATVISLVMPVSPEYPAHRWIRFGGISLQSVELVKLALIVSLSAFLEKRMSQGKVGDMSKTLKPLAIILGVTGVIVAVLQKDLGSTAVIMAMMAAMAFVAGLPLMRIMQAVGVIVIAMMVLILPFGYRRDRISTFINPEVDCQAAGYQACQALIAVGSGGIIGRGLSNSGQAYGYLPEAANDSIFAIIAEKSGFVGATLLVVLLTAFFARIKNVMERAPDDFSRLMVAGVLAWLSTQAFINIGAMIGLLPLKGITLPLISYGGTSVVFVMAAIGLVFNISRYTSYAVNRGESSSGRLSPERNTNESRWNSRGLRKQSTVEPKVSVQSFSNRRNNK